MDRELDGSNGRPPRLANKGCPYGVLRAACARLGAIASAKKCRGETDKLVVTLGRWLGKGNAQKEGDVVHVVYPRCLCHQVAKGPERLPDACCLCSRGWLKEMFETVVNRPVEVELLESVKRGAEQCRFTVTL